MILQKLSGVLIVLLGVLSACLTSDGTAAVMFVPWGIWLMFSRKYMMMFNASLKKTAQSRSRSVIQKRSA